MPNPGFHLSGLLGFLDVVGAIYYFCLTAGSISKQDKKSSAIESDVLKVYELLFCPIALFLSGLILHFNGWRLDPILQFQQLLFHLIVGVALFKQTQKLARDR